MDEENKIITVDDITDEMLFEPDTFVWIYSIEDELERENIIYELLERAVAMKRKVEFKDKLTAAKREWKKHRKESMMDSYSDNRVQDFTDCPYRLLNCGSWIADDSGIIGRGKDDSFIQASYTPITIVNVCANKETGEEKACIAFKKNGQWKEITPNKATIATSAKIVQLADTGLGVTSENAKHIVRYLSDLEGHNKGMIPVIRSTSKFGWHKINGELKFLPYDEEAIHFDASDKFNRLCDSLRPSGTFSGWQDIVRSIRKEGRIEPRIMLAASFASVLVEIVGTLPFLVHLFGETEGGKTVCLMLAASIWANPNKSSGYMGDWQTTLVAVEERANVLNHLPIMMDDTAKAQKRLQDDFAEFIYILSNGTGKERSTDKIGLRTPNTWSNCTLTTGEHPIVRENEQGGAINRVIEVHVGHEAIFENGHDIVEKLKKNYGHAGKKFIEAVKSLGVERIREYYDTAYKELLGRETTSKQAMSAAVIILADMIATGADIYGCKGTEYNAPITPREMSLVMKTHGDVSEDKRCYDWICDSVSVNQSKFQDDYTYGERWGKLSEDGETAYIVASVFKKLCEDGGYAWRPFLEWADRRKLITYSNESRRMSQVRIGKSRPFCVVIKVL